MIGKKMFGQQLVNIILYHTIFTCMIGCCLKNIYVICGLHPGNY